MNIFEQWDNEVDKEGLLADVRDAEQNGGGGTTYKEVPHGRYEVAVEKMELKASKKGKPMVSIWFKIVSEGDYKGSMLFYNQIILEGFQIHIVNEFLRSLTDALPGVVIEFTGYEAYQNLLLDIHEAIADKFEYGLDYRANAKNPNFNEFRITDIFELE